MEGFCAATSVFRDSLNDTDDGLSLLVAADLLQGQIEETANVFCADLKGFETLYISFREQLPDTDEVRFETCT
jgi:hypothetical protein